MNAILLTRQKIENEEVQSNQKGRLLPEDVSKHQRRLLDIAWRMYDITSEMSYLRRDVANLTNKVNSFEKEKKRGEKRVEFDVTGDNAAEEEFSSVGERTVDLLGKEMNQSRGNRERSSLKFDMDDLSFSIFKEIVSEITAECVGKMTAVQNEMKNRRLREIEESSKEKRKQIGDSDVKGILKRQVAPLEDRYKEMAKLRSSDLYNKGISSDSDVVGIDFRRNSSTTDEGSSIYEPYFSKLDDSLYFHRSHLGPMEITRFRSKSENTTRRRSSAASSDGSDFL